MLYSSKGIAVSYSGWLIIPEAAFTAYLHPILSIMMHKGAAYEICRV